MAFPAVLASFSSSIFGSIPKKITSTSLIAFSIVAFTSGDNELKIKNISLLVVINVLEIIEYNSIVALKSRCYFK